MFRPLCCAFGFLTRIPVPHVTLTESEVARSAAFFPWVGLLIGAILWATTLAFEPFGAPIAAIGVVSVWAFITGSLHLDGLADTVDGLSGGRGNRERALEIMRDSRIGAHGATALMLALALKTAALVRARELGVQEVWFAPCVARFACTLLLATFPYARTSGLGSAFAGRVGAREVALSALALLVPLGVHRELVWDYAVASLVGLACAFGLAWRVHQKLGGLTGDVHGAAIELCEIGMLLGLCAFHLH